MRVFLSVAGPDRPKAEAVASALTSDGHRVFFDRNSLPPGKNYHRQIRDAILQADLIVFFLSTHSLQHDRYTMTELEIIKSRFPNPDGRVLPVLVSSVDFKTVPQYLKMVTVHTPKGDIGADVAFQIARMSDSHVVNRPGGDGARSEIAMPTKVFLTALGLGSLAVLVALLTNEFARSLRDMHMPLISFQLLHGSALTLVVWLAGLLCEVKNPVAYLGLAGGCIGAFLFEHYAWSLMQDNLVGINMGKALVVAAFAAVTVPGFKSSSRWVSLALAGAIAGQMAISFGRPWSVFSWEALVVATLGFFMALQEEETVRGK